MWRKVIIILLLLVGVTYDCLTSAATIRQVDSLLAVGDEYAAHSDYFRAGLSYDKAIEAQEAIDTSSKKYLHMLLKSADARIMCGADDSRAFWPNEGRKISKYVEGHLNAKDTDYADAALAMAYFTEYGWAELTQEALDIYTAQYGHGHPKIADCHFAKAYRYRYDREFETALKHADKATRIYKAAGIEYARKYQRAKALQALIIRIQSTPKKKKVHPYDTITAEDELDAPNTYFATKSPDGTSSIERHFGPVPDINAMSDYYYSLMDERRSLTDIVNKARNGKFDTDTALMWARSLEGRSRSWFRTGLGNMADETENLLVLLSALKIYNRYWAPNDPRLARRYYRATDIINKATQHPFEQKHYAIDAALNCLWNLEVNDSIDTQSYIRTMLNLVQVFSKSKRHAEAIVAMNLARNHQLYNSPGITEDLKNEALKWVLKSYLSEGDYSGYLLCREEIGSDDNVVRWIENDLLYDLFVSPGIFLMETGKYHEAYDALTFATDVIKRYHPSVESRSQQLFVKELALRCHEKIYGASATLPLQKQLVDDCVRRGGDNYIWLIPCTRASLARYNALSGHYDEAFAIAKQTIEVIENDLFPEIERLKRDNRPNKYTGETLISALYPDDVLAQYYLTFARLTNNIPFMATYSAENALKLTEIAYDYVRKALELAPENSDMKALYAVVLGNLVGRYIHLQNYERAANCAEEGINFLEDYIARHISSMTTVERAGYWNNNKIWLTSTIHVAAFNCPGDELAKTAYDAALFSKGLLLHGEQTLNELMKNADSDTRRKYQKLRQLELHSNSLDKSASTKERNNLTDSIESLQRMLLGKIRASADYAADLTTRWEDVRNVLGPDDVAIEFVRYQEGDSIRYAAYVLLPEAQTPQGISLFTESELVSVARDAYSTTALYSILWKPLEKYISKSKRIFFSPDGQLQTIGIEHLPTTDGDYTDDKFEIYRLSSTRQLVTSSSSIDYPEATVYGGLGYDDNNDTSSSDNHDVFPMTRGEDLRKLGLARVDYLPYTLEEAKSICSTLGALDWQINLFSGAKGTESSFRRLSGKKMSVLHIATHGFYWNERESRILAKNISFLKKDADMNLEDKALSRSGLMFAGVNQAFEAETAIPSSNDGVVTAAELSRLDFSDVDLVVLSACQTALGDISDDGVFGLQRGFKKAGAKSLLMTLWKVDDKATSKFMTSFYDNIVAGKNKRQALTDARRSLRTFIAPDGSVPYADPRYWAAFILLDGLDTIH